MTDTTTALAVDCGCPTCSATIPGEPCFGCGHVHPAPADLDTVRRAVREHEVFDRISDDSPWKVCQHGKRFVEVMAHWSDDAPFTVTSGRVNSTQHFPRTVHADGSGEYSIGGCYNTVNRCPKCKSIDTLATAQEAWCDVTTCSACDYENVYMIGD